MKSGEVEKVIRTNLKSKVLITDKKGMKLQEVVDFEPLFEQSCYMLDVLKDDFLEKQRDGSYTVK